MKKLQTAYLQMQVLILFFLFLGSMEFLSLHYHYIYIAFVFCVIFSCWKISLDTSTVFLILFAFSYVLFWPATTESIASALKPFTYPICYCIGLNFLKIPKLNRLILEKQVRRAIIVVSMGAFTHYLLNFISNITSSQRNTIDIWSGETRSATGQAALAVMACSVFIALLFSVETQKNKLISVIGLIIVLSYNLVLAGRTLIVMFLILTTTAYLLFQKKSSISGKVLNLLKMTLLIAVIICLYELNFAGIKDIISNSNLYQRFRLESLSESGRLMRKRRFLELVFVYPWGGGKIHSHVDGYAHDIFLDTYSDVGIVGIIFLIAFMISVIYRFIQIIRKYNLSSNILILIVLVNLAMFLEFMIEPILVGMQWMFNCFCFIQGLMSKIYLSKFALTKEVMLNEDIVD